MKTSIAKCIHILMEWMCVCGAQGKKRERIEKERTKRGPPFSLYVLSLLPLSLPLNCLLLYYY